MTANPATGTASISIPIACSPARAGLAPQLSLTYDSGIGNGPFGFGWALSLPQITRKTDTGLPRYDDTAQSDVFLLSGAEDLVPVLGPDGVRLVDVTSASGYSIHRYRPRAEGLFALVERWTRELDGDVHWRSISRDNVLTLYGHRADARIFDPLDPRRIFTWLISETRDDRGNAIVYDYKAENGEGVDLGWARERNRGARDDLRRTANRYLKRIRYGNREPLLDESGRRPRLLSDTQLAAVSWMFELVLDYGEHDRERPTPASVRPWSYRGDPFSVYRAGFEVRTSRLCRRVLMFHHFAAEPGVGDACLARSYDFTHRAASELMTTPYSHLQSVTQSSYRRNANGYSKRSVPPVEYRYSQAAVQDTVQEVSPGDLAHLPFGLDGATYTWTDLHGEGIPGILVEQGDEWFYQRNLTPISDRGVAFSPVELVASRPNVELHDGHAQLVDLAGDGHPDVVRFDGPFAGFYEHDDAEGWKPFRPLVARAILDEHDSNLRFIDLDGDGRADLLISDEEAFVWYPSLGEDGFGPARRVRHALDEDQGPRLVFSDTTESIHLADMTGDGLADVVRIRNSEICYWPNLGFGQFGAKVTMDHAPRLDHPDQLDQDRIRLADVDGSGPADLVYLHPDGVRLYFNQSGNRWSEPRTLGAFPRIDNLASIQVLDLLGNGTACLVWSSSLPGDRRRNLRYADLRGGQKPHLLVGCVNNLGAEIAIEYASSTRFYLEDRMAGRPWITRLPIPVHVVERVETRDLINGNRFVARYTYHHGYFDDVEREFRGFGLVEQLDAEAIPALGSGQPPVLTRTWFHTGARPLEGSGTVLPAGLTTDEEREAHRTLAGSMLRQEVYAIDGTAKEPHPYTVVEQTFEARCVQRRATNRHAVFMVHPRESVTFHYDRNPEDPRISHQFTLDVDRFGDVLATAVVGYGRQIVDPALDVFDQERQARISVCYTAAAFTNHVETAGEYRAPICSELQSYEITGLVPRHPNARFSFDEVADAGRGALEIAYEQRATTGLLQKRLVDNVRTVFRRNDLTAALPLGRLESLAIPFETYKLAFTPGLVARIYGGKVADATLAGHCGYVQFEDDRWWVPSGRAYFATADGPALELVNAQQHFFSVRRHVDPFGNATLVTYDAYDLLVVETRDPLNNVVSVGERDASGNVITPGNDYRVLAPWIVTDANDNRLAVSFDTLGMVVGTAVMGKRGALPRQGDLLEAFEPDLPDEVMASQFADPLAAPVAVLGSATSRLVYDMFAFHRTRDEAQPSPIAVYSLVRETHDADLAAGAQSVFQHSFSYSDGFGREIQKKAGAEPGPDAMPRWVGTGWTVFNNKGNPVRQYEAFFAASHRFEPNGRVGVSPVTLYDPIARIVAMIHPDHSWSKTVFGPWRQTTWDVNDTVLIADPAQDPDVGQMVRALDAAEYLPTWHARRSGGALGPDQEDAATKAAAHAGTPTVAYTDSLGRVVLTVIHDRVSEAGVLLERYCKTRIELDIEDNVREVHDALGRVVARYDYDMLGTRCLESGMDTGDCHALTDVAGRAVHTWDQRGHMTQTEYDPLGRPTVRRVRGHDPQQPDAAIVFEQIEYGETSPEATQRNLRLKPAVHRDPTGVSTHEAYDFKGNLLRSSRRLASEYKTAVDWSVAQPLDADVFTTSTTFDALNRTVATVAPDGSVCRPRFNASNLLERVDVTLKGESLATAFVSSVAYDAKGQRQRLEYGTGVVTSYAYDPLTLRLTRLRTQRAGVMLQDVVVTYDAAGNVTRSRDHAVQTVYFANQVVAGDSDYTYSAGYRLVAATGREHIGQAAQPESSWHDQSRTHLAHPNDGQAMRRYVERYRYDDAGNLTRVAHTAAGGSWTRTYAYGEPSALDSSAVGNRLTSTTTGGASPVVESLTYDVHGNPVAMPHLATLGWDFRDSLQSVDLGGGGTAYYTYDSTGQRTRKVIERNGGRHVETRVYVGGFELYRELHDGAVTLARETLHVMDDQRRLALVESRVAGDEPGVPAQMIRYQLASPLGSASLELDGVGQIVSYEEYFPFGSTSYQAVRSQVDVPKRYRYVAMERDEETGFAYHTARYYLPWLGRWLSADPIGIDGGLNLYAYCDNNPISRTDTNGQSPTIDEINKSIDTNRDQKISLDEVGNIGCLSDVSYADWAVMMSLSRNNGYAVDANVRGLIDVLLRHRASERSRDFKRMEEAHDNSQRMGSKGNGYNLRDSRAGGERSINRHRDPRRLAATAVVAATVLAPEVVAVVGAFNTGVKTGEVITKTHSGIGISDLLSGDIGKAGNAMSSSAHRAAGRETLTGWLGIGLTAWATAASPVPRSRSQIGGGTIGIDDSDAAEAAYAAIRADSTDVAKIATNTGLTQRSIEKVKRHIFYEKHLLDRFVDLGYPAEWRVFDASSAMARSWLRLTSGTHGKSDIALLRHETAEAWFMRKFGPSYKNAHDRASVKYPSPY